MWKPFYVAGIPCGNAYEQEVLRWGNRVAGSYVFRPCEPKELDNGAVTEAFK
jgi:hypothetical protein